MTNNRQDSIEQRIQEIGKEIFAKSAEGGLNIFNKANLSGKMMEWSMKYPSFKIEMFRFVDVLPSLNTTDQLVEHVDEYFLRDNLNFPAVIRAGLGAASLTGFTAKIAANTIRKNIEMMSNVFITGHDSQSANANLEKLWNSGYCFTVDILGEAALSESEALSYQARYIELIEGLSKKVLSWKKQDLLESVPGGSVPRANVSVKCSSLYSQIDPAAFDSSCEKIKERLRPILRSAIENNVFLNLDMEQYDYREILLSVSEQIFMENEFKNYPYFGIVIQAYLKSAGADLARMIAFSSARPKPITVRLVKGAYWDYEVIQSKQRHWPIPVFTDKAATDANYEKCAELLLSAWPHIHSAFASHNVRSLAHAMAFAESKGLPKNAFEIQMLYGMAESFKRAVSALGYRVREYAPVGDMLPGMAYLVRRLLENTSNEGFLRAKFNDNASTEKLLSDPNTRIKIQSSERKENAFENEGFLDYSVLQNRTWIAPTLQHWKQKFPLTIQPLINGKEINGKSKTNSRVLEVTNPSNKSQVISKISLGVTDDALAAVDVCKSALQTWGKTSYKHRASILNKAAEIMRTKKNELAALIVLECAKSFKEADADICEAIDFCTYYAVSLEKLFSENRAISQPGESNTYTYKPRGIAVAIAPWNFPLAILCGLTVAPLVCGNPVIMKPAEQSSAIGFELYKILREAGVPADALQFLPGLGEDVGATLVNHKDVHIINFTGSRAVGLKIISEASQLRPGQKHIKKVLAELGGKNALIIDDDADLDEAVMGSLHSAFGFQGQKCSALSRIIIHEACYDKFKKRFIEAMHSLKVGPSEDPSHKVNPVIDEDAQSRLLNVIARNKDKIAAQLDIPESLKTSGHYVPPTLFEATDAHSELGQEEFFGPLVTLFKVKNFEEALKVFNDVEYALTGGIFSRTPSHVEKARDVLECGNLYVNRGITGALVGRQPFGGYKLSGVGAKAGGPDYLLQFLEPQTITENTMRRGFAPEI